MLPIQKSVTYVGNKGISKAKIEKHERFKRYRVKSCRSISLPVKNMASGSPRGHISTGIFSTDKVFSKNGMNLVYCRQMERTGIGIISVKIGKISES